MSERVSIVALLPSPASVRPCLEAAVAAAEGLDAGLRALHVGFAPGAAGASPEEAALQQLRAVSEGPATERAAATRAAFDAWLADKSPVPEPVWADDEGDVEALVASDTAAADLVVMRNPRHLDGRDAFHAVLFRSRRLVLVAPHMPMAQPPTVGRHILIGWKPGPQAERALRAAAPWLRKAGRVSVLCVGEDDGYCASAQAALEGLGIEAAPEAVARDGSGVGRQLLAEAARRGADTLLIGAFHRGMLWETILGGVTRDILADAGLPVFMCG
ncbi:MAG: universal stress protein [Rubellimicrobium sp.]|nr:universal stress protein [Rubellimicrobium sp.]